MKLELSLSNLITKASRVVTREYQAEVAPLGITPSQAGIVYILDRIEPATQVEVARILHLDKANTNAMIKKLLTAKIVSISKDKNDARKTILLLTAKGKDLAKKLITVDARVADVFHNLCDSPEEKHIITRFLEKIVFDFEGREH